MKKIKQLDPKRPWRSDFWEMANLQHKIWVLMMSSSIFWAATVLLLIVSFAISIHWANMHIASNFLRKVLEMGIVASIFIFGLGILVLIFEITFYLRDFIHNKFVKKGN
jgi:hypothetical protein